MAESDGFKLHLSGSKVYIGPVGAEPIAIIGDEAVFADEHGVSRTEYIGTIGEVEEEWE